MINGARTGTFIEESLSEDLQLLHEFSVPSGPSATYAELVAAGRLKLIHNDDLRSKLKTYDDYVVLVRSDYGVFTDSLLQTRDVMMRAQTLDITGVPKIDLSSVLQVESVDRELLANDTEIRTQLQIAYAVQDNIFAVLHRNREEILQIIDMIETEIAA